MPFGGALTIGLIGAGSNLANGAMGSKAAGKAASTLNKAGIWSADKILDTASSVNKDLGAALPAATSAVQTAADKAGAGVTSAANAAATGVQQAAGSAANAVYGGVTGANQTLKDVLSQQQNALNPYLAMGSTAADAYTKALAPGGGLASAFSFNPNDVQNNLDYQFTLQQGLKSLQNAGSAAGTSQGGATAKALARYAAGAATQGIDASYQRALSTYQANRQNLLASLGMGLSSGQAATNTLSSALQNYGNQAGANTLYGATYAGNASQDAAKYAGTTGLQGAEYAGNTGMQAGLFTGQSTLQTALQQAQNYMNAANLAGQYRMQGAGAQAAGTMAGANAWGNSLSGISNLATALYGMKAGYNPYSSGGTTAYMTPNQTGWGGGSSVTPSDPWSSFGGGESVIYPTAPNVNPYGEYTSLASALQNQLYNPTLSTVTP